MDEEFPRLLEQGRTNVSAGPGTAIVGRLLRTSVEGLTARSRIFYESDIDSPADHPRWPGPSRDGSIMRDESDGSGWPTLRPPPVAKIGNDGRRRLFQRVAGGGPVPTGGKYSGRDVSTGSTVPGGRT